MFFNKCGLSCEMANQLGLKMASALNGVLGGFDVNSQDEGRKIIFNFGSEHWPSGLGANAI